MCSIVKAGALLFVRPKAFVHNDNKIQEAKKIIDNHAVNFFNTSAVEVPKSESDASPPNEAPSPELLLSCNKITPQSKTQSSINRAIVKK